MQPAPITETWRWTHLEQFTQLGFRCIAEAADGSVWLGFDRNVVHFDGLRETSFDESAGVPGLPMRSLCVARDGRVYALTGTHLLRFDKGKWQTLATVSNTSVPGNRIQEGPDGALWALTPTELLCVRGDEVSRSADLPLPLSHFAVDRNNTVWLASQQGGRVWECPVREGRLSPPSERTAHAVYSARASGQFTLFAAQDGGIWIVSFNETLAPARFDPHSRRWQMIDLEAHGGTFCNFDIAETSDGAVWIAGRGRLQIVRGDEIAVYTQASLQMLPFYRYSLLAGRGGILWLCGVGGYVYRIDTSDARWSSQLNLGFQCEGIDGAEWFLSRDNQVVVHRPTSDTWTRFTEADGMMDRPVAVLATRRGDVWAAGSHRNRAAVARLEGGKWVVERHPAFALGIARQSLYEADNGDLWFGAEFERNVSAGCSGGLLRYTRAEDGTWSSSTVTPPHVPFRIISIAEDDEGGLWMGGEELRHLKNGRAADTGIPASSGGPRFVHVARGADRTLWVAHWGNGVYRRARNRWTHFTTKDGLGSDFVAGIAADRKGALWVASPGNTSRFDGERWVRAALPSQFGLDLGPSHLRTGGDGAVWVVTNLEGWYAPRRAPSNGAETAAPALLQSFRYKPASHPPLVMIDTQPGVLSEHQPAVFLWHGIDRWSATPGSLLQYSHRIDGGPWSPFSTEHSATLTGLAPGRHTIEVRVRDCDLNIAPQPASASFTVLPPVWRQPWFMALVAGFLAIIAGLIAWIVHLRIRHVWQLGEMKLQFFANLSHELRTPLTVILGPLDHLIDESRDPRHRSLLETVRRNAAHMLRLVDQILDFRRLEVQALPPSPEPTEVAALLRAQEERLRPHAEDKRLALRFEASPDEIHALVDRDMFVKIADNLVSNAIKYTPAGGEIGVSLRLECEEAGRPEVGECLVLAVTDSGIGIPREEQEHIFDLFFRARNARSPQTAGAGLGLAFTRELVGRCGGTIRVESPIHPPEKPERGSRFTVRLPVKTTAPAGGGSVSKQAQPQALAPVPTPAAGEPNLSEETPFPAAGDSSGAADERPVVLIVEDNADIRRLLCEELADTCSVLEAEDGLRGLALAEEHLPACIVADIMMPGLDGIALCSRIKGAELTSHIPVLMLTARSSDESQLQGLDAGADDYLAKPVSFAVLKARVLNLIASRAKLREHFSRKVYLAPKEVAITPVNEQFIRRAIETVEQHMADEDFDVDHFARAMGLSRASLFRKFKAISGMTPSDFIRDLRLERARQLLAGGQFNVSQTAAAVGFQDLSHFASCFRKKFGSTPSAFAAGKGTINPQSTESRP